LAPAKTRDNTCSRSILYGDELLRSPVDRFGKIPSACPSKRRTDNAGFAVTILGRRRIREFEVLGHNQAELLREIGILSYRNFPGRLTFGGLIGPTQ